MKLPLAFCAAAALLSSCGGSSKSTYSQGPEEFEQVRSRSDLDAFSGQNVAVEGTFGHVGARHGTVTLRSGLIIYVPHFDEFKRGDDWLKYVGREVRVVGILHTEAPRVAGVSGPLINIRRFETLDFTE